MKFVTMMICALVLPRIAKAWTSALYPPSWTPPVAADFYTDAFLQDWSYAGYHRGELEPPRAGDARLSGFRIFRVTDAPFRADNTGNTDATSAIQAALDSAAKAGGGVVFLPAGTYRISTGSNPQALSIRKSNIILRGEGPERTFLWNTTTEMNSKSILKTSGAGSWSSIPSKRTAVAADLRNPTSVVPVEDVGGFAVGDQIILRNRITDGWISEHKESDWLGKSAKFTGIVYQRRILSIDASAGTITLDAPVRYSLLRRDSAMVHASPSMLEEVGLEDFSLGNSQIATTSGWGENDYSVAGSAGYDAHASYAINFHGVRDGWIRNVRSFQPEGNTSGAHLLSNGILLNQTRGVLVDSCEIGHLQYGGGGGNGYAYRVSGNENMIRDCRSWFTRHGFVLSHMLASGNVFLRDHDKETGLQTGLVGSEVTSGNGSDNHMHFSHSNLFDRCTSENSVFLAQYRPYGSDPRHDLTAAHTLYWNTEGLGAGVKGSTDLIRTSQARYGYVIGTRGTRTSVRNAASNSTSDSILLKTEPLDSVEGEGMGETLSPASLWRDQYGKRVSGEPTSVRTGDGKFLDARFQGGALLLHPPAGPVEIVLQDLRGRTLLRRKVEGPTILPGISRGVYVLRSRRGLEPGLPRILANGE
ncbi:MAG: hypothetical protein H6686_12505 [Fibrobacteria bacterium]|nr:hypothetical protein [Fibrobacteria bacterium]